MTERIIIEADGGSRGNPGPAGSGVLLIEVSSGKVLAEAAIFLGIATNNFAEYKAVITGLELANELAPEAQILIRMDSKLVVEQMSGRWKIKHEQMADLSTELAELIGNRYVDFEWIPREQNYKADALANEAMDAEKSSIRKFTGQSLIVETSQAKVSVVDAEYNPLLPSSVRAPRNISKQLTTVILVRHGRTLLTESHRISGRGGEDPQLSDLGVLDATKAGLELAKVGVTGSFASIIKPTAILASPIARAQETASVIGKQLGLAVEILEDLAEIAFGDWDGHTNQEVATNWPDLYSQWRGDELISPPGGGESLSDFDKRVQRGRREILEKYAGQTVIVVSHVMPIRGFLKAAIAADWPAYWRTSIAPCSLTILRFWGDEAAEISCVNYSGHL